jgi:hypothetical protein
MTTPRLRLLPALAFAFAASVVHAQDAGDDDKQALRAFSDAYGIVELWPRMAPKIARDSLPRLREAAFADLAADMATDPLADPGARARAEARLDGLVTGARSELEAALQALDAAELADYTAFAIYARYFETAEIRAMTAFFGSPTGRKMTALSPAILAETRQPGSGQVLARHFSEAELREIAAFWASPLGEKMGRTALDIREAMHRHFIERSEPALQALARRLASKARE